MGKRVFLLVHATAQQRRGRPGSPLAHTFRPALLCRPGQGLSAAAGEEQTSSPGLITSGLAFLLAVGCRALPPSPHVCTSNTRVTVLCCPGEVQGLLSQVPQLVRGRASSPTLISSGLACLQLLKSVGPAL